MLVLRQFCQDGVPVAELVLPFELRTKRRLLTQTADGEEVGVLLPSDSRSLRGQSQFARGGLFVGR